MVIEPFWFVSEISCAQGKGDTDNLRKERGDAAEKHKTHE